jgi:hypothetical protein
VFVQAEVAFADSLFAAESLESEFGFAQSPTHKNNVVWPSTGPQQGSTGSDFADHGNVD